MTSLANVTSINNQTTSLMVYKGKANLQFLSLFLYQSFTQQEPILSFLQGSMQGCKYRNARKFLICTNTLNKYTFVSINISTCIHILTRPILPKYLSNVNRCYLIIDIIDQNTSHATVKFRAKLMWLIQNQFSLNL